MTEPTTDTERELWELLREADPEHFMVTSGKRPFLAWCQDPERTVFGACEVLDWRIAGWMIDQMPKGTLTGWQGLPIHGFGATRQEAIVRAYAAWCQAGRPEK